ncbi:MAG: hypothetical protein V2A69_08205 [Pseudomonadota bacterium]
MRYRLAKKIVFFVSCCFAVSFPGLVLAKDYLYVPLVNGLQIIDCETDTVVETIPAYKDYIVQAAFSPDKQRYYLNAFDRVYAFDSMTKKLVDTYKFSHPLSRVTVFGFTVSEDSTKLYLSCTIVKKKHNIPKLNVLPPQLVVYDIATKQVVKNFEIPYCATGVLTLRNDTSHLIIVGLDIYNLNLQNGKLEKIKGLLNPEAGEESKNNLVIWQNGSPGDHGIFTNPYYTKTGMGYLIIDRNTGEVRTLPAKDVWMEYSTILSPDKKYIYAVMDELIKIDRETGATVKAVPVGKGTSYAMCTTADGKKVYVGPAGNDVSVYDTSTLDLIKVIPLSGDGITAHRLSY